MLLKGMSDNVKVSIVEQVNKTNKLPKVSPVPLKETRPTPSIVTILPTSNTTTNTTSNTNTTNNTNTTRTTPVVDTSKTIKRRNQPRNLRMWTGSLQKDSVSQTKNHVPSQSACTDTEPEDTEEVYYGIGGWSDTDADPTIRKSPRRLILPLVFLQDCRATPSGRPPAPWKIRKAVSMSTVAVPQQSNSLETTLMTETTTMTTDTTTETLTVKPKKIGLLTPEGVLQPRMSEIIPTRSMTLAKEELVVPVVEIPKQVVTLPVARCTVLSSSHMKSIDIGSMVDEEVVQLLLDIRRIGVNPGEPSVTFGELFDDDVVQNTYEALVGTLRSAKRQGKIHFQGQMLLKGMHDRVVISIVEDI
jgi:Costars